MNGITHKDQQLAWISPFFYDQTERHNTKLTVWDTAGNEKFRSIVQAYFRGARGFLLIYDITNRESFENITKWFKEAEYENKEARKILIGNKSDLEDLRQVSYEEGRLLGEKLGMRFFEISAKTAENIYFVAKLFAKEEVERKKALESGNMNLLSSHQKQEKQIKPKCYST